MKLLVITCHNQPDYIRAVTLRQAAKDQPNLTVKVIKNKHTGMLRYLEMPIRLLHSKITFRPDIFLLTFRGYEILPFAKLISFRKKLIYDEFINPIEWLNEPRDERWARYIPKKLFAKFYRSLVKNIALVLADTPAHAKYSAKLSRLPLNKYHSLPVGTDEEIFYPDKKVRKYPKFTVFYYGNMLPLHGLDTVLEASRKLSNLPIKFILVGGGNRAKQQVLAENNPNLEYRQWIAFEALPFTIRKSHLCLGGPFGDTIQARRVITGKTYQFMACGVATLIGENQVSDIFKDQYNCLSVKQKDSEQLANKILWAYKHQNQLIKIGEQGHKLYQKELSSKVISAQFKNLLNDLV